LALDNDGKSPPNIPIWNRLYIELNISLCWFIVSSISLVSVYYLNISSVVFNDSGVLITFLNITNWKNADPIIINVNTDKKYNMSIILINIVFIKYEKFLNACKKFNIWNYARNIDND
jgi:hypothetical protein